MTQQEKDQLHIEKQDRRLRKLIWDNFSTAFYALLILLPLFPFVVLTLCTKPQEPVEATFIRCYRGYHCDLLQTKEEGTFQLSGSMNEDILPDVESGMLKPGDRLKITWHPWIINDGAIVITCGDRVYGDMKEWKTWKKKTIRDLVVIFAVVFIIGLIISAWMFYLDRKEFAEIRAMRQKYKTRLQDAAEPDGQTRQ